MFRKRLAGGTVLGGISFVNVVMTSRSVFVEGWALN